MSNLKKRVLTDEQTNKLIEIGVPKYKATYKFEIWTAESGMVDYKYSFSIMDLLEIIPEYFEVPVNDDMMELELWMEFSNGYWDVGHSTLHEVYYPYCVTERNVELIDALYNLILQHVKLGHFKYFNTF